MQVWFLKPLSNTFWPQICELIKFWPKLNLVLFQDSHYAFQSIYALHFFGPVQLAACLSHCVANLQCSQHLLQDLCFVPIRLLGPGALLWSIEMSNNDTASGKLEHWACIHPLSLNIHPAYSLTKIHPQDCTVSRNRKANMTWMGPYRQPHAVAVPRWMDLVVEVSRFKFQIATAAQRPWIVLTYSFRSWHKTGNDNQNQNLQEDRSATQAATFLQQLCSTV